MRRLKITFGFCALVCVLGWLDHVFCLWFLLCSAAHELGHLLMMKLCRVPVEGVCLTASGAVIEGGFPSYRTEVLCAAAGPVAGLFSAVLLIPIAPRGAAVGLLLSIVNLLPLYTLDGGRILRGVLLLCCSEERARTIAYVVSVSVSCLLMLLACWATVSLQAGLWPIFAAMMLLWRAGERDQ